MVFKESWMGKMQPSESERLYWERREVNKKVFQKLRGMLADDEDYRCEGLGEMEIELERGFSPCQVILTMQDQSGNLSCGFMGPGVTKIMYCVDKRVERSSIYAEREKEGDYAEVLGNSGNDLFLRTLRDLEEKGVPVLEAVFGIEG